MTTTKGPADSRDALGERLGAWLYLCTDAHTGTADLAPFVQWAVTGWRGHRAAAGKRGPVTNWMHCVWVAEVCHRHGALFAVNDRADLPLATGADVLHLGQDDQFPELARL